MIIQYLKKDIKSYHSNRFYGRKGDKVTVISRDVSGLIKVMTLSGNMFFIKEEYLSIELVEKDIETKKNINKKRR